MGEAAQRANSDPSFGRIPKAVKGQKRGLVISFPVQIFARSMLANPALDPQELRYSLLYWDELVLPQNNILRTESGPLEQFLVDAGVLTLRQQQVSGSGDMAELYGQSHIQTFKELDAESPGKWSLATGVNSFSWDSLPDGTSDGVALELFRAIPVPNVDVPLEEILEFKTRRSAELWALRAEIDTFTTSISKAENAHEELTQKSAHVQKACVDLLSVGNEWKFPVRVADLKCSFELNPGSAFAAVASAYAVNTVIAMPEVSAIVGGALSVLKLKGDFKLQPMRPRTTPYQYVYSFHEELF